MQRRQNKTTKERKWQIILAHQKRSNKAIKEYCSEQGINYHTYYYWRKKLRESENKKSSFLPVLLNENATTHVSHTKVHLPNGVYLEIGDDIENKHVVAMVKTLCGVGCE